MGCQLLFYKADAPKFYCKTDQKALNGNIILPKKASYGDKIVINNRHVISVIKNAYSSRILFIPY